MSAKTILLALLLASIAISSSSSPIGCRCPKARKAVNWNNVDEVIVYDPRSYCRKTEVIVILKNRRSRCVDPSVAIPEGFLQANQNHTKAHASGPRSAGSGQTALPQASVML